MPTLTLQQAHNGAAKSAQVRRAQKIELVALRIRVAELERALPAQPPPEPKGNIPELLTRTREQLDSIDKQLADCTDAKEWDCLTRSRERNFRIWAHLAGIPNPGSLKPSQPRQSQRSATVEPIGPAPQSSAIQAMPEQRNPGPGGPGQVG